MYLGASLLSFIFVQYAAGIAALFLLATLVYFIFIVYTIHSTLSFMSLIGFIMFEPAVLVYVYDRDGVYHHQAL